MNRLTTSPGSWQYDLSLAIGFMHSNKIEMVLLQCPGDTSGKNAEFIQCRSVVFRAVQWQTAKSGAESLYDFGFAIMQSYLYYVSFHLFLQSREVVAIFCVAIL